MTGRERMRNLLAGRPLDRLAWTTLVDDTTRSVMPPQWRELPVLEFYRELGCDVLQFGSYGLPPELCVTCARLVQPEMTRRRETAGEATLEHRETPWGTLTSASQGGRLRQYPVRSREDLVTLRRVWEESRYEAVPECGEAYARVEAALGEQGVYALTLDPSPVQYLLEYECGVEGFWGLAADYPAELEALLEAMQARRREEYELAGRLFPGEAVILVENTSTTLISPAQYRRLSLPQIQDFTGIMRRHGKLPVLHMCGLLRGLLPELAETGMAGANAVTPPPVGDLPWEVALDYLGEDFLLLGGIFQTTVFQALRVRREEIEAELERTYRPRLRQARLLMWLGADGLPTPIERFLAVRDWMEQHGAL